MWCLWGCGEGWLMVGEFCVVLWAVVLGKSEGVISTRILVRPFSAWLRGEISDSTIL